MKKLKKVLVGILACLTVGAFALGVAACDNDTVENGSGNTGLPNTNVNNGGEEEKPSNGELEYALNWDESCYVVSGMGDCTDTDIVIAAEYKGLPVKHIEYKAFYDCSWLASVMIPDSVTSIGGCAFSGCWSLTSVEIPDFVTNLGDKAFEKCDSLTSVVIGDSVTTIGNWLFAGCDSLESIQIGCSVASIGEESFEDCRSLTSITVDENNGAYKSIDGNLYSKDEKVLLRYASGKKATSFSIPNSVTRIAQAAFQYCMSLTDVVIGDAVTMIGPYAFNYCMSLTSVTFKGTLEQWNAIETGIYWENEVPATEVVCSNGKGRI